MSGPNRRRPGDQSPLAFVLPVSVETVRTATQTEEPAAPAAPPTPVPEVSEPPAAQKAARKPRTTATPPAAAADDDSKTAVTFSIRTSLKKRAEMAVLTTAMYPGGHRSLAGLLDTAIERELERLAEEFNGGEAFKPNSGGFRQGRPFGQ